MLSVASLSSEYKCKAFNIRTKGSRFFKKNSHKKPHENITRKNLRLVQILPFPKYPVLHVHL